MTISKAVHCKLFLVCGSDRINCPETPYNVIIGKLVSLLQHHEV